MVRKMELTDLHEYQKRAIKRMINEPELALFLDLGLGKTIVSLVALKRLLTTKRVKRVLIVAPLSVVHNVWVQEARKWSYTEDLHFTILHGAEKSGRLISPAPIHLINYEGLIWWCDIVRRRFKVFPYDTIIFDESSKVKSHKTKRFKQIKGLMKFFKRRYLLTATPAPNSLMDLWSQFYVLDLGKTLGSAFYSFLHYHFYEAYQYNWQLKPGAKEDIHELVAPKTIRLDNKDYLQLPKISYNRITLNMSAGLMKKYRELEREFFLELEETAIEVFNAGALSMKLRQFIQGGLYDRDHGWHDVHKIKLEALKDLVDTAAGNPVLCAIQFKGELAMIRKAFKKAPVIAGGTSVKDAQQYIEDWNEGKIPLLLCHPASLSHGVNLQAGGHTMLWYGITWSFEQYAQLNGRLYRQGQNKHVVVHHLVMNDTIDEAVMEALGRKEVTQTLLLDFLKTWKRR